MLFYNPPRSAVIRFVTFIISAVNNIMFLNIFGQRVIDKSVKIFDSTYCDTNWYLMSPKLRYLIYIIMIRSTHPVKLSAGNIIDVSNESAGDVNILM